MATMIAIEDLACPKCGGMYRDQTVEKIEEPENDGRFESVEREGYSKVMARETVIDE